MLQLYTWTTPNGRKISIALEEMGLPYAAHAVDITKGDQHTPKFLKINANHKIPSLVDEGGTIINESGAILLYLAQRSRQFMPDYGTPAYWQMMEWLMWQMAGFGPMLGQAHHFLHYNAGKSDYAETRYHTETRRLYGVLEGHLRNSPYMIDMLSIADFAVWPWVSRFEYHRIDLTEFPAVRAWYEALAARPAFARGYAQPVDVGPIPMPG
ncbi:glutathione S-transferase family protein [Actibacterium sp. 188UL27-1]|uniref:glutathione S-transferase family protein n=1 Tax=Actibacterium sp. 188UL27-1 TaxID=2786961 RepID=UPI00195D1230|nr:glutathione S-transferase N-terminal domain-containing protein [Actibacterium sp. 188UL27-1]MBM7069261.1 glutathione S-transferase N-terminal domain-containing protein [Actibacterium sp. 188UL27-1]